MSFLDFSDAGSQGGGPRGLIPEGALAIGKFKLKPYSAENNVLSKVSSKGNTTISAEYEITYPDAYLGWASLHLIGGDLTGLADALVAMLDGLQTPGGAE